MDSNLLLKEKQYRKMNDEFKVKTGKLLKEIEDSIDEEFTDLIKDDIHTKDLSNVSCIRSTNISTESTIRILQAKVKVLSEQLSTIKSDYVKRTDEWKSLQCEIVKIEENSLKNKQTLLTTHDQLKKQEILVATISGHLQVRDKENNILKKQIEALKRELAQQESTANSNDVRLNRSLEEIERLKDTLKKSQQEEKNLREINRVRQDEFKKSLSRLEKQKTEITTAFKKQMCLIANLKKQQSILETSCLLSLTEDEFFKILDWTPGFA